MKTYNIGGVERTTITYANHILPFVEHVGIFAQKGIYDHTNIINENVALHFSFGKISNLLTFILNFYKIFRIIKKNKINIVHYHQRIFILYIFLIKLFNRNIKIVYTHHNVFNDILNRFIYSDVFIAVSNATKNDLQKYREKCLVIKHGIESSQFPFVSVNRDVVNIGFVGRFYPSKGIHLLLKAFHSVCKSHQSLNLLLVGEGKLHKMIEEFINRNDLIEKVFILPPQPNTHDVFSKLDLLIVPSEKLEGFGLVIIEAMRIGIPVIASDLPVFCEIIKDNKNGILFTTGNLEELIDAIQNVIENHDLRSRLSISAYNAVVFDYSFENCISKYREVYSSI